MIYRMNLTSEEFLEISDIFDRQPNLQICSKPEGKYELLEKNQAFSPL